MLLRNRILGVTIILKTGYIHGLLIKAAILTWKSVSVSSKNLTYFGLIDFGNDGRQGTGTDDLTMHGLVIMYQSFTEKCTQPNATFVSNSYVNEKKLAKLILKAIYLTDEIGFAIHGVIGDNASTNRKIEKILGVSGQIDDENLVYSSPSRTIKYLFSLTC